MIFYALLFSALKSVGQCPTVQPSFTISPMELCTTNFYNTITLTNTSTGTGANMATYDWYIGSFAAVNHSATTNGLSGPGAVQIQDSGEGFVYLISNFAGCRDTVKVKLVVSPPPTANFTFDNNNKCAGTTITFTNTSTAAETYATYLWDFGDNTTSTLKNPTHSYATNGTYNVKLTTTNNSICDDDSPIKTITVTAAPEADFTYSTTACTNNSVSFTNTSIGTDGTTIYTWDFGDATPTSNQQNPTHTYTVAGSYNITLTVSNGASCSNTSPNAVITVNDAPTATFTFTNNNQCAGTNISFSNTSANTTGATNYSWNFGDSNSSLLKNPTHTYSAAGTYTVTLTVSNGSNCAAVSVPTVITVTSSPIASFTVANNNQCVGTVVSFTNTSTATSGTTNYQWDFGDGTNSTAVNPTHTYTTGGTYNVKLTASNGGSCSTISPVTAVIVKATPVSTFTFNSASCTSMSVSFSNTSTTNGATGSYLWTFGDGNTSTQENPTYVYPSSGIFNATLKITNVATGCSNTSAISKIIVGNLPPVLNFTMSPLTGCSPRTVTFTNTSTGTVPANNFDWDFGNGNTLIGVKDPPTQLYHEGTWTIRLISGNTCGIDTLYKTIIVDTMPKAIATPLPLKGCLPINFTAINNSTGGNLKYQWFVNGVLTDTTKIISNKIFTTSSNTVQLKVSNSCGTDDTTFTITSRPTVETVISPLKSTICSANDFSFTYTQTSVGDSLTYLWDFDNGNSSTLANPPAQTFLNPGTYTPKLIVKNRCGSDTSIAVLTVYPVPLAPIARDTIICTGTSVSLTATGSGVGAKYEWFDTPGGTLLTVGAVYKTPVLTQNTTYYVQVTLLDCTSPMKAVKVTVKPLPLPPTVTNDTICAGDSTLLTATGTAGNGFEWYSTLTGGSILGSAANFQTPALTITTDYYVQSTMGGCSSSTRVKGTVKVMPLPATPTVPKTGVCIGNIATVTATAPGGIYQWFDAPTNGTLLQTGATYVTPVLNADVTYYVQTQMSGCTSPRKAVLVTASPLPFVDIIADDTLGCTGMTVNYKTNSTTGATYSWYFFGGSPSTSTQYTPAPIKYNIPGNNILTYLSVNMLGCIKYDSIRIQVKSAPIATYTVNSAEGCSPVTVNINNTSSSVSGDAYLWDFDNGTTSTIFNPPPITYTATGTDSTYAIKLIISSPGGCADTSIQQITVHSNPIVSFKSSVNKACANDEITFTSESIGALSWKWYLGDGTISTDKLVKHTYTTSGTYTIKLVVIGSFGCSDSVSHDIIVNANPIANYTATTICNTAPTVFTDFSTGATKWEWNFGDATPIDNSSSPVHLFSQAGTYNVKLSVTNALGCVDSSIQKVTVLERPDANFVFKNSCARDVVNFKDSTIAANPTNWTWSFGDGATSTSTNAQHIYTNGGNYFVTLIVKNNLGCSDTITKTIKVSTVPTPLFKANVSCLGKVTSFTDLSTDSEPIVKWFYDFNDGNNSVSQNPTYIYSNPGTYNVSLIVTNINGCDSMFTLPVKVDVIPKANYVADTICVSNPTTFTDISLGTVLKWEWDFGDGTFDTIGPITTHVYPMAGSYLTSLKIYTLGGCTDEKFKIVVVRNDVKAGLTVKDSACMFEVVNMYDNSTSAGMIVSTAWNFGDGSAEIYTTNASHAYTKSGMFIITHKAVGVGGCESRVYDTIYISPSPTADFVSANTCANQGGAFTDKSIGSPVTWEWDFDDGDTSQRQNPTHIYLKAGVYNTQLTIKTALGCKDSIIKRVIVFSNPTASFTSNIACWGDTTNFTNTSNPMDGSIIKTWWDFDDSTYSVDLNPNHIFVIKKDTFHVKMVIVTSHGCIDTIEQTVTTHPIPTFKYKASSFSGCNPFTAIFHDSSTVAGGTIVNWLWNFGDKSLAYNNDPAHIYTTEGKFFVSLTITSSYGCRMADTLKYPIVVYPKPIAEFTVDPKETSMFEPTIKLTDESIDATLWNWDLGDKTISTDQNVIHIYADTGIFVIMQVAMNPYGCKDTAMHEVRINGEPTIFIPNAFTPDGNGLNDVFLPKIFGVREFNMAIYNRWGDLIFTSIDSEVGWNGRVNGTGEIVKDDTYIYKLYIRDLRGNPRIFKGKITLIKKGEEPD